MQRSLHFALIGAAGYVAPRHMKAIKATNNMLIAAYDPFDSVGVMDQYFPNAAFFVEFERFDRHLEKLKRQGQPVDYVVICSPNYLHDAHIRFGLRLGAHVICEKPIVLNPWNLAPLLEIEAEASRSVNCILQLRLHPNVLALKQKVKQEPNGVYDIDLTYITSRGHWYYASWKGDPARSGGIATNIGVHFFDLLIWVFGEVLQQEVHVHTHDRAAGFLQLERARVRWFLSINEATLPMEVRAAGNRTYRALTIAQEAFDFSSGFQDLHTTSYENILNGNGFNMKEAKPAIQLIHEIRNEKVSLGNQQTRHPLVDLPLAPHPFERRNHQTKS